ELRSLSACFTLCRESVRPFQRIARSRLRRQVERRQPLRQRPGFGAFPGRAAVARFACTESGSGRAAMTRPWLAAIALVGLGHNAGAQLREATPCQIPEGQPQQECGAKLWELPTSGKAATKTATSPPLSGDWVVSETTSPVDYSPQVSASNRSRASAENAPSSFTIRCRLRRIELSVSTAGSWKASTNHQIPGAYRMRQRPTDEP